MLSTHGYMSKRFNAALETLSPHPNGNGRQPRLQSPSIASIMLLLWFCTSNTNKSLSICVNLTSKSCVSPAPSTTLPTTPVGIVTVIVTCYYCRFCLFLLAYCYITNYPLNITTSVVCLFLLLVLWVRNWEMDQHRNYLRVSHAVAIRCWLGYRHLKAQPGWALKMFTQLTGRWCRLSAGPSWGWWLNYWQLLPQHGRESQGSWFSYMVPNF